MIINWFDMLRHHSEGITEGLACEDALHFGIRSSETPYKWVVLSGTEVLREGAVRDTEIKIKTTLGPAVYNPSALVRLDLDGESEGSDFNEGRWQTLRSQLVGEVYDDLEDHVRILLEFAGCILSHLADTDVRGDGERYYIAMTIFELRNFLDRYEEWHNETGDMPSHFLLRGLLLVRETLQHLEEAL